MQDAELQRIAHGPPKHIFSTSSQIQIVLALKQGGEIFCAREGPLQRHELDAARGRVHEIDDDREKCEQAEDPHSPHVYGIKTVLLQGAELYRHEAKNQDTLDRYGHGTPNDWMEKNIYSKFTYLGITIMLLIDLLLFGGWGLWIWFIQIIWIPFWAAGVINGIGHYWGYRNGETKDHSRNIIPWGIVIGGEELHNNHHIDPANPKLSKKVWELDIGWMWLSIFRQLKLAKLKKE